MFVCKFNNEYHGIDLVEEFNDNTCNYIGSNLKKIEISIKFETTGAALCVSFTKFKEACVLISIFSYGSALLCSLSWCLVHMNNIWNNRESKIY